MVFLVAFFFIHPRLYKEACHPHHTYQSPRSCDRECSHIAHGIMWLRLMYNVTTLSCFFVFFLKPSLISLHSLTRSPLCSRPMQSTHSPHWSHTVMSTSPQDPILVTTPKMPTTNKVENKHINPRPAHVLILPLWFYTPLHIRTVIFPPSEQFTAWLLTECAFKLSHFYDREEKSVFNVITSR